MYIQHKPTIVRGFCVFMMTIFRKTSLIQNQLSVFLAWGKRHDKTYHEKLLYEFIDLLPINDIVDVTDDLITDFLESTIKKYNNSAYHVQAARSSINSFKRFYMARGKNLGRPVGRPPHIEKIERAKNYKALGLSFNEIKKLMKGVDVSLLHRWVKYDTAKLALYKDIKEKFGK